MVNDIEKIALVTGSSKRIGKYIIEKLAIEGWSIALHFHESEKEAYEIAKNLLQITNIIAFKADLTKKTEAINLIEQVNKTLGPVNLLVNNASIHKNDHFLNFVESDFTNNLNLHLSAPLYLSKEIAKQNNRANIINILDSDISRNIKNFFSYSITKKSLENLTRMLAVILAPDIRVNAIAPGPTLFKEGQKIEVFNQLIEESPLKKGLDLEEIYQTIKFLVNSNSITGQVLYLDGGRHLL